MANPELTWNFDKLLLEQNPDAIIATTVEGVILFWSKGAEAMFGYSGSEIVGLSLYETIIPTDRVDEEKQILRETVQIGLSNYECLRKKKDGSLLYVDISSKSVRNADGDLKFVLHSKKDVTQLKVQRDVRFLNQKYSDLLESMPDAIFMMDVTGQIVLATTQAENLFGYEPDELLGRSVETLMPPRYGRRHVAHRVEYLVQPRARAMGQGLELSGLRKDGVEFPLEISLSPMRTAEGTFVMTAIRDITDRKRAERELQQKNAELAAANQELESFSYSVSHDLRAPVRAMTGFAQVLENTLGDKLSSDSRNALERIRDNAVRMTRLIDGLLAFSGLSRQPVVKQTVAVEPIVRRVWDELRSDFADRAFQIEIGELPACEADATLLQQVYANLLSNAVKYTRGRNPAIIKVGSRREEKRCIYFVEDNGAGFQMEFAGKLFGVFQRLHSIEEFEGTGVGLAIVQRIVQRHGGSVWAEGQLNRGAKFSFTLNDPTVVARTA